MQCGYMWDIRGNRKLCRNGGSKVFFKDEIVIAVCDYNFKDFKENYPDWQYMGKIEDVFKK